MLKVLKYERRSQIGELFSTYNPTKQTWLVSDLRTKFELQQRLLEKNKYYEDEAVLRASDLWRLLLRRLEPQVRDVSDSFIRSLLKSFLDDNAETLGVNAASEESVFAYMDLLSSAHLHPEGPERLTEWFTEHPESAQAWQIWSVRSRVSMQYLVNRHGVISGKWVTAYLQKFDRFEKVWSQDLIVDLGGEISRVEAEILRTLSRHVDVTILEPVPIWKSEFKYLLKPYEDFRAQASSVADLDIVPAAVPEVEILRLSGMLAEVKQAVAQTRIWLEQGIPSTEISVIAPDIEAYWPVLQTYFEMEGVLLQKDTTAKLQSLPSVIRWMATLRTRSGRLSATDLEISFYDTDSSQQLRYEKFKALFKTLYAEEDLQRDEFIFELYHQQLVTNKPLTRDQFVRCGLDFWYGADDEAVQLVLRELLQNAREETQLHWKEWLGYLESIVSAKEYPIAKGVYDGVMVTKLMSAHSSKSKNRIFMGLSEEALRKRSKVKLMSQDYYSLAQDIGFYLENPDQSDLEFELRLLAEADARQDFYFFGATDFAGALLSPSSFWIDLKSHRGGMEELEKLTVPGITRWDEVQGSDLPRLERLEMDLGHIPAPPISVRPWPRISASSLESFLKCPFIFASQKYFRLQDLPEIDLDVDHRTRGQLAHALFEKLTADAGGLMRFDWSDEEINQILEQARVDRRIVFADERLWEPFKKKHFHIARRFLEIEKNWRQQFPQTRTIAREKRFEFYFNPFDGKFSKEAPTDVSADTTASTESRYFRLSGQFDRIDRDDQNQLVLLDYKSSTASAYSPGTWIEKGHIQLLMYMWVVEVEMMEGVQGDVIGLFYYIFKNFEKKGFRLDERAGSLYPPFKRKTKNNDQATKEKFRDEFYELLTGSLKRIASGEIQPNPADLDDCKRCEWRRLCRAPHLN